MNWDKRHLNWALILGAVTCHMGFALWVMLRAMHISGFLITFPMFLLISLGFLVFTRAIQNKGRSAFWSLLILIPFGWLPLLLLENRNGQKTLETEESQSEADTEKEEHEIQSTESQEEEYRHSVWDIYRKAWETASPTKRKEINERMLRWQELMKNGLPPSQAYYKVMQGELDETP